MPITKLRIELSLFIALCIVQIIPVWIPSVFLSGDAPAHLYNSRIISALLFEANSPFEKFFEIAVSPIPNLLGHFLLVVLNLVFQPIVSEKLVFTLAILLFPISFRILVARHNPYIAYLAIPFAFSFLTCIGFQSFCLAFGLLFLCIYFWNSLFVKASASCVVTLLFFSTLLYFGHLLPYLVFNFYVFIYAAFYVLRKRAIPSSVYFIVLAFICCLSALGLFSMHKDLQDLVERKYVGIQILLNWLFTARPLTCLNAEPELLLGKIFAGVCFGTLVCSLYSLVQKENRNLRVNESFLSLFFTIFAVFVAFFKVPDWTGSAGFISMRFCLITWALFLAIVAFLSSKNSIFNYLIVAFVSVIIVFRTIYFTKEYKILGNEVSLLVSASKAIPSGKVVLPINYGCHWLDFNIASYLALTNDIILLDNYEADKVHFPTKWKQGMYPGNRIGNVVSSSRPRLDFSGYEAQTGVKIDYIVRHCWSKDFKDTSTVYTNSVIDSSFTPIVELGNGEVEVFKRKP